MHVDGRTDGLIIHQDGSQGVFCGEVSWVLVGVCVDSRDVLR